MADNVAITAGAGTSIATDEVSGTLEHVQLFKLAISTDGSRTLVPVDANGVTVQGAVADGVAVAGRPVLVAGQDGTNAQTLKTDSTGSLQVDIESMPGCVVAGDVAHDTGDSGNPVKVGHKAVAHGTNPTAVTAGDRTDWYSNRAGVPFVMGGHPNIVTVKHANITTAVTDTAIITVSAGTKIVVTSFQVTLDNASTVFPSVLIGFGTANTPTTTGVIGAHGGVPAGGGFGRGDGSGIIGIGADDADLRITTVGNATGNGLQVVVTYYTIES